MRTFVLSVLLAVMVSHPARAEEGKRVGSIIGLDKAQNFICKRQSGYKVVAWAYEQLNTLPEDEARAADEMSKKTFRNMTKSLGDPSKFREGSLQASLVKLLCRTIDAALAKVEDKHLREQ